MIAADDDQYSDALIGGALLDKLRRDEILNRNAHRLVKTLSRLPMRVQGLSQINWRELADQKRSRLSRGEMTPFSERGSANLLKVIAVVKVAVLVEVVVD